MQCPQCSAAVADSSRFCTSCGATITQPAAMDKTMALSNLPPMTSPVDKTQAINPAQVPAAQPNYGPPAPVQPNYGPPAQSNAYSQQGFSQPQQYGQMPPANYGQVPMGYAVPNQAGYAAIPAANGSIPAILMIVSALAILIGIFLPLIVISGTNISLLQMLDPQYAQDVVSDGAAIFVYGVPAGAGLMLLLGIMAFIKRRNLWGGLNILPSLFVLGITGLLLIGAAVSEDIDQAGSGLLLMTVSAAAALVASIAFLIRKKQPR
ncbi:hypothetical protein [Herpetosiphon gulosus]|uniref:Zinc-ribbon domain-containing protein n=1 Tax=Herpetosiphon gulosus TaxID=1973496 RepID=A0ABP9X1G3_9CHLR